MNSTRFDRLTRHLATGLSRRSLLGGVAAAGAASIAGMDASLAQDATPATAPTAAQTNWLLVVNFEGAELAIQEDGRGMTITLTGVDNHVMAFTDRPARDYHLTPLEIAAAAVNTAASSDPLNATLVARPVLARDSLDLVVVLRSATVDSENSKLVLDAKVLGGPLLGRVPRLAPGEPAKMRGGSLFVDDVTLGSGGSCAEVGYHCGWDEDTQETVQCCAGQDVTCQLWEVYGTGVPPDGFTIYMCLPPRPQCDPNGVDCSEVACCDGHECGCV